MLGIGDLLGVLLIGPTGGDEDHLVEVEGRLDLARGDEVPVVDGVEGAAHDTDPTGAICHISGGRRCPSTTGPRRPS
ncbi:Uncharacterised protein [Mycobacteroides abscessus subsp. abscessus]|nr:Uncharacterised protein [Mycobacteroides abscessus subsp. abscessus]